MHPKLVSSGYTGFIWSDYIHFKDCCRIITQGLLALSFLLQISESNAWLLQKKENRLKTFIFWTFQTFSKAVSFSNLLPKMKRDTEYLLLHTMFKSVLPLDLAELAREPLESPSSKWRIWRECILWGFGPAISSLLSSSYLLWHYKTKLKNTDYELIIMYFITCFGVVPGMFFETAIQFLSSDKLNAEWLNKDFKIRSRAEG